MCMSSGDSDDLDRILEVPLSNELVIVMMTESPQQPGCSQNLLGVVLARTNDAGGMAEVPSHKGRTRELLGGGLCLGPCLSLADTLSWPHQKIVSYVKTLASSLHPQKFIPTKIKH